MTSPESSGQDDPRAAALDRLGAAVLELAEEGRRDREARSRRDRLHLLLLAVVTLLVAALGTLAVQNRQLHSGNAAVLDSVRDCTTEGGQCYEQSEQRLAAAIRDLVVAQLDVAWCVRVSATKADAEKCVADAQRTGGK